MASPHIAGLLAYFVSLQPGSDSEFFVSDKGVSPGQLKKNLINYATKNILTDIPNDGTPNLLAFNGAGHNLTSFWNGEAVEETEEKEKTVSLGAKVDELIAKVEKDSSHLVDDVKKLVSDLYNKE